MLGWSRQEVCALSILTIPEDFSGTHRGNFEGELCVCGEGGGGGEESDPPTWSGDSVAEVCSFDRIEMEGDPLGGKTPHGSQGNYTVTAYDDNGNDITDLVEFSWTKIEYPLGGEGGAIETDLGGGSSKTVDFRVVDVGDLSPAACRAPSAVTLVHVVGTYCEETHEDFFGINVTKGEVVDSRTFDKIISDTTGAFRDEDIATPVVVPKTDVDGSVTKSLSGTFTLEGSVTVSGSAEGSVAPFGVGVKVTVGVSGTTTVSQQDEESVSVTVNTDDECDIRIRIIRRVALRTVIWRNITERTYDTGYDEQCITGEGEGNGQEAEIRTPITKENCD